MLSTNVNRQHLLNDDVKMTRLNNIMFHFYWKKNVQIPKVNKKRIPVRIFEEYHAPPYR